MQNHVQKSGLPIALAGWETKIEIATSPDQKTTKEIHMLFFSPKALIILTASLLLVGILRKRLRKTVQVKFIGEKFVAFPSERLKGEKKALIKKEYLTVVKQVGEKGAGRIIEELGTTIAIEYVKKAGVDALELFDRVGGIGALEMVRAIEGRASLFLVKELGPVDALVLGRRVGYGMVFDLVRYFGAQGTISLLREVGGKTVKENHTYIRGAIEKKISLNTLIAYLKKKKK